MNLQMPSEKRPIYIIGAGGIVNEAHLPAYQIAGFNVQGIFDIDLAKATATANEFSIPGVFQSLDEMIANAPSNALFDVAVPGSQTIPILKQLPSNAAVLLQKPMGENFEQAKQILHLVREKKQLAAINFQLRYAPYILAAKKLISENKLGELNDIEINVNVYTPWHLWDFLVAASRVEILYHSIHYIDLIRNLLGNPVSVYAKTTRHPSTPQLASVRSNIIMDYGDFTRANILTNHCHNYGMSRQQSYIKIEGSKGAVLINFGALINYPRGAADSFEYVFLKDGEEPQWKKMEIEGSWFPHAFIGSMAQLMLAAEGSIKRPDNSVEDCIYTMACTEAAYLSSEQGGVLLPAIN
ncbi:Gfo/Idh/MocA family protein [Terrimonas pollutisoli]|uniref:Gfo/Idh/MocA family protein n=1 Tax=Terrimonas pollutisoli TaxID=3034147 RepID=UPI0023EA9AA7|nr:Gfo/Idh/MocA family oxidoreductase [Terrimonas sp. H1YJ31]